MTLPKRKKNRLNNYNYNRNGYYFITICAKNHQCIFSNVTDNNLILNKYGMIVAKHINRIDKLSNSVKIVKYIIMPNHIHMILALCRESIVCVPQVDSTKSQISKIIQSFKSAITKEIWAYYQSNTLKQNGMHKNSALHTIWQKSFHDHIILNEKQYQKIWNYIDTNQQKWLLDCYNPSNLKPNDKKHPM
ncbi:transposase [Clostridium sp. 'deep sea']|uniref:transposase n=1 Tax=Clostridium sp. 'deep sea' TaxID=2779445 RepID=UPI001896A015|nr:transposase [Clostridium sp. 'deep sea']QOR34761.1 transposase [Clostridium sp. 'deep sea']